MDPETVVTWLATGLGLGSLPLLPGTFGALPGLLLAFGIGHLRWRGRLVATLLLVLLALPLCELGSRNLGGDDARIVADEMLTFPVATLALPVASRPALLTGTFVISRVLDGLKPPPANLAEQLPGGLGIVLDDVSANAWTLVLGLAAWYGWRRYRGLDTRS